MGTINQPKPSSPKSPQPEQSPLEPGQTTSANPDRVSPERTNFQTPDSQSDTFGSNDEGRNRND
jgi:hypothetical protein